ncbi:hypothetical protein J6590_032240, partial [Homalodisca vitripennis]
LYSSVRKCSTNVVPNCVGDKCIVTVMAYSPCECHPANSPFFGPHSTLRSRPDRVVQPNSLSQRHCRVYFFTKIYWIDGERERETDTKTDGQTRGLTFQFSTFDSIKLKTPKIIRFFVGPRQTFIPSFKSLRPIYEELSPRSHKTNRWSTPIPTTLLVLKPAAAILRASRNAKRRPEKLKNCSARA